MPSFKVRVLAILASALVLFGQLSALLHITLVKHVRCAAHGELVHAGTEHVDSDETDGGAAHLRASDAHGHGHEHCGFVATHHVADAIDAGPLAARSTFASGVPARSNAATNSISAIELLLLAPKSSPPV